MSTLKSKWYNYVYLPNAWLPISFIIISLIGSAIIGYLTPKVINELYEVYSKNKGNFHNVVVTLAALFIFEYISSVVYQLSLNRYIQRLLQNIRSTSYQKWILTYESIGKGTFSSRNYPMGEVLSRILNDTEAIIEMVSSGSFKIFIDLTFIVSCLISFIELNTVSGVALIVAEIFACIVLIIGSQKMAKVYMEVRKSTGKLNRAMADISSGLRFIFHTPNNSFSSKSSIGPNEDFLKKQLKANIFDASYFAIAESLFPILLALLVIIFPYSNITEMAVLAAIIDLIQRSISPIKEVANKISSIQRAKTGIERIIEFNHDLDTLPSESINASISSIKNFKSFEMSVPYFTYPRKKGAKDSQDNFQLGEINFEGKKGELIGIVGMSGSGKSTVLKILSTEIIAEESMLVIKTDDNKEITFNSNDFTGISHYKRQVSIISQDSHVFSESLKFNITFGQKSKAQFDLFWQQVQKEITYLTKWGIEPEDILSPKDLSLGQKQLICALRSCFLVRPIVLFDEISSGLDSDLEEALRKLVLMIQKNSLTIIVAHRVETITKSDKILVMEGGKIIERGKHSELMDKSKTYKRFIEQTSANTLKVKQSTT